MAELKTIPFFGTCLARGELTLVSKRIATPYQLHTLHVCFPAGTINLLAMRFYTSSDNEAPAAGAPNGVSILRDYGQVDYLIGDGTDKDLQHQVSVAEAGTYLKVYAVNTDFFDHVVDVQITIEIQPDH
jgi:hypothetical protein